ncbi:MAG: choice-of-anchor Q domain-containing protein, partial [Chloroflexota bacterium]
MKHNLWGRTISILILLTLAFSILGITPAHAAATITVNSTADNAIAADGQCTLREALTNANGDRDTSGGDCVAGAGVDTIQFAAALGTATITLTSALPDITDNDALTMDGDNRITVSGNDSVRVFRVLQGGLTLQNISVVHGRATEGAGLYTANDSANAVINCTFANNVATLYGGGIRHDSTSTLTILNSTFSSNHADLEGGGVSLKNGRTASIANSTFTNNSAPFGGGVANTEHSTVTISNSTFSDNHADSEGGGMGNNSGGTVSITNSTFTNNSANYGGGVSNNSATMTIVNSTFSGNTAPASGGGLMTYQTDEPPVTTVYNSIFANSVSPNDCMVFGSVGTLTGGNNIIETTPTGATGCDSIKISSEDPLLGGLGSYGGFTQTIPLLPGSSAIDAGNPTYCTTGHDQREVAYVGACDIGAFESQGFSLAITGGNNQSVFTNAPFPLSLAVSVTAHAAIEPVNGGRVTFTPPASGASADLTGSPAVISGGSASVTAQANGTHGIYTVTAGASGAGSVDFSLTNRSSSGMITPTITWNNPANIVYGTALDNTQLNATADTAGTFTYTPASGTILAAGTHTLHVDFVPTDETNYTTASKDVSITVTKAAPVLTWNNPA